MPLADQPCPFSKTKCPFYCSAKVLYNETFVSINIFLFCLASNDFQTRTHAEKFLVAIINTVHKQYKENRMKNEEQTNVDRSEPNWTTTKQKSLETFVVVS